MIARNKETQRGLLLPLYIYPGANWAKVVEAKNNHRTTPFIAIINPASGPGKFPDPKYVSGIKDLQFAEIKVLGYVFTSYGSRKVDSVKGEIELYDKWYGVDGIMFDEMGLSAKERKYYSSLDVHAKRNLGMSLTVGNPGKQIPDGYDTELSILNIYEDSGIPSILSPSSLPRQKLSAIAYGINKLDSTSISKLSTEAAYVYLTDCVMPNPYERLPSFFTDLVDGIASSE